MTKSVARGVLRAHGFELVRTARMEWLETHIAANDFACRQGLDILELALHKLASVHSRPFFVQIGANDGLRDDDLRSHILAFQMEGILVEPQPGAFTRLAANYSGQPGLRFENAAITKDSGSATLFGFSDRDRFTNLDVFSSFDYQYVRRIRDEFRVTSPIEGFQVPALSLADLLTKHGVSRLDVLVIDTEGYDFEIIKTIDFGTIAPPIIQFEHINLSPAERLECNRMLAAEGYRLGMSVRDTIALRHDCFGAG
ncbi:MAG TPA: FkbM family methyltransferase [Vicinamibacterales bacterium]